MSVLKFLKLNDTERSVRCYNHILVLYTEVTTVFSISQRGKLMQIILDVEGIRDDPLTLGRFDGAKAPVPPQKYYGPSWVRAMLTIRRKMESNASE